VVAAADRVEIDKAITAVKAGDYAAAVASLKKAAENVQLTPDQQKAIKDLLVQVQAKLGPASGAVTEAIKKAGDEAGKAIGEAAAKALGK